MRLFRHTFTKLYKFLLIVFILETLYLLDQLVTDIDRELKINTKTDSEVFEGCTGRISSIITRVFKSTASFEMTTVSCADREEYFIIRDVFKTFKMRKIFGEGDVITIITQTTPNHIEALDLLLQRWSGPVSVAIFLCVKDIAAILRSLFRYGDMTVSFHFVAIDWNHENSSVCEMMMTPNTGFINPREKRVRYPYNVLRNVALSSVRNGYVFMTDIDLVPSVNLHDDFLSHVASISNDNKVPDNYISPEVYMLKFRTAYVIPSFESFNKYYYADDKNEIIAYVQKGLVRQYAYESCKHCQNNTNYKRWLSNPLHGDYEIPMSVYRYEPFFILHHSSYPSFDERFKDRGLNRLAQVCETYMSGVNFRVLNSGFLLHRGFRPRRIKDYEKKNYLIYNNMKKTLKLKYDTSRECDVIANYSRIQTTTTKPVLAKPN